ncbi:hypothetical protein PLEOSDRAFT_156293 [Pleurotus ostreatus PC15]|uniref:Uncharacterized protein n=1 Tax=Pleurotus ostreatus (strain PC15) TaxID=1137138 RepID=A0A067NY45_PLEO1|nr:hypothetical protein PLEOSDRAFT_156293 [Pleurotus ostreatus PC15]
MASPHPSQSDVSDYMDAEDAMDIEEARTPRNWNSTFEAEIIAESGNTSDGYVGNHDEDVNHVQDHPMTRQDFVDISQYLGELSSAVHEAAEINKQIFDSLLSEVRTNLNATSPVGDSGRRFPAFAGSAGEEAVLLRVFDAIESNSQSKGTLERGAARSRLRAAGRDWSIHHEEDYSPSQDEEDHSPSRHLEVARCLYLLILFSHIILSFHIILLHLR